MAEFQTITEIFSGDDIAVEMTSDAQKLVPLDPSVVADVTEGDDDPKFATFVIPSGWSKSRRFWGPELFQNIAEQVNDQTEAIVGYQGHIPEADDPFVFPDIQLQWLGAKVIQAGEQAKLAVKAYVLPGTKARQYLDRKRPLVRTVSWRGKISQIPFEKGVRVKQFFIESIDLSRPRAAGLNARMVGGLTSEMESEGGKDVKPEEIAALQENELRAHNPALAKAIEDGAKSPLETKVGEMESEAAAVKPTLDLIPELRKLLGLDENSDSVTVLKSVVGRLREEGKKLRDTIVDSVLEKKFKDADSADAKLLKRLVASEMHSKDVKITGDNDADEKVVTEMVNSIIDGDDSLKKIASEMEQTPPAPPTTTTSKSGDDKDRYKAGSQTSNIRVRSAG